MSVSLSVVHVGNDASCLTQGGKEANERGKGGGERSSCWSSGEWAAAPLLCLKCCEMGNPGSRGRAVCQTPSPRLRTAGARMARGALRRPAVARSGGRAVLVSEVILAVAGAADLGEEESKWCGKKINEINAD